MTNTQYNALLTLFNEWYEVFCELPDKVQAQFFDRLYSR